MALTGHALWVENRIVDRSPRLADPEFQRCVDTICALGAPYNIGHSDGRYWHADPWSVRLRMPSRFAHLSTFDAASLTALVLAAHRNYVRIQVNAAPGGPGGAALVITAHPRRPKVSDNDHLFDWHPGLADLAARATDLAETLPPPVTQQDDADLSVPPKGARRRVGGGWEWLDHMGRRIGSIYPVPAERDDEVPVPAGQWVVSIGGSEEWPAVAWLAADEADARLFVAECHSAAAAGLKPEP